jgi:hypothetical protein
MGQQSAKFNKKMSKDAQHKMLEQIKKSWINWKFIKSNLFDGTNNMCTNHNITYWHGSNIEGKS